MDLPTLYTIEICAGVGMLGEGLRAGLAHLGRTHRTVAYLEREAYAASVLVARMEEGSLDAAPVWPDLLTFDGRRFRGAVDCIAAGFPCQDLSLAGRRAGLDGARSGLFFNILDIADDCDAANLFLENVAGIASATASVVDEAEGALDERAAARVLGELADRGWNAEWLTLSASDVGASHGRSRWFCWAWRRLDNAHGNGAQRPGRAQFSFDAGREELGDTGLQHQHLQQREDGAEHSGAGQPVAHAQRAGRRAQCVTGTSSQQGHDGRRPEAHGGTGVADAVLGHAASTRCEECGQCGQCGQCELSAQAGSGLHHRPELAGIQLADPTGHGRHQGRPESGGEQGRSDVAECGGAVADTTDNRHERGKGRDTDRSLLLPPKQEHRRGPACGAGEPVGCGIAMATPAARDAKGTNSADHMNRTEQESCRPTAQLHHDALFAPGPADPRWGAILAARPHLAPALEPAFRGVVNGLAFDMGDSRAARLKCVGNGVVALCAATAFVILARRAGFMTNQPLAPVKTAQAAINSVAEMVTT